MAYLHFIVTLRLRVKASHARKPSSLSLKRKVEGFCVERWPSGQWQQTVNLPGQPYVGSNPTLSTIFFYNDNFDLSSFKRGEGLL